MTWRIKDFLVSHGLSEVINYSFVAPSSCDRILLGDDDFRRQGVRLLNPLSEELSVMRTTLLPGLLETAVKNVSVRNLDLKIFEMRRVYLPVEGEELPQEPLYLSALFTGRRNQEGWNQGKDAIDFYDVKGVVENVLATVNVRAVSFSTDRLEPYFHPGKACRIAAGNQTLGSFGELHPTVQEKYGIDAPVYYLELNFEKLLSSKAKRSTVQAPSRFPDTFRDIAMLLPDEISAAEVLACVNGVKAAELQGVELFDLYKGGNIPAGQKSIAIRVRYGSRERTLTDEEVTSVHQSVIAALQKKLNATMR